MRREVEEGEPPTCPECGHPLSCDVEVNPETGEIEVWLYCEGPGDDVFSLVIKTGLRNEDLNEFKDVGKEEARTVRVQLVERRPEED